MEKTLTARKGEVLRDWKCESATSPLLNLKSISKLEEVDVMNTFTAVLSSDSISR